MHLLSPTFPLVVSFSVSVAPSLLGFLVQPSIIAPSLLFFSAFVLFHRNFPVRHSQISIRALIGRAAQLPLLPVALSEFFRYVLCNANAVGPFLPPSAAVHMFRCKTRLSACSHSRCADKKEARGEHDTGCFRANQNTECRSALHKDAAVAMLGISVPV